MNKYAVVNELIHMANELDTKHFYQEADILTKIAAELNGEKPIHERDMELIGDWPMERPINDEDMYINPETANAKVDVEEAKWRKDFSGQDLTDEDFSGEDLQEANFTEAELQRTNFSGANLQGANFTEAEILRTNFSGANLQGANFTDADVIEANCEGANLQGINCCDSAWIKVNIRDADLRGAKLKEVGMWDNPITNEGTKFDPHQTRFDII